MQTKGKIKLPTIPKNCEHNAHIFYLLAQNEEERAKLLNHLKKNGINAVFHYIPLHSSVAGIKYRRRDGELFITDDVAGKIVRLPIFFGMKKADIEYIVATIKEFFERKF